MNRELTEEASKRYRTPFYVFDMDILRERITKMKTLLSGRAALCYAIKANPFLVGALEGYADRFEICSPGEYRIYREAGIKDGSMVFSGVYKDRETLYDALDSYCETGIFTAESMQHLTLMDVWSREHGRKVNIILRLTSGNQFGMDEDAVKQIIRDRKNYPWLCFTGLHYFSGTQKRNVSKIEKELKYLDAFCMELYRDYGFPVRELEYGPGAAVSYFEGGRPAPELEETVAAMSRALDGMRFGGHVTLEMGRFFAAMCGDYFTRVCDIKQNKGENYCIVDGGLHHLNYDGQLKGMYLPFMEQIPSRTGEPVESFHICGALCTVNDVICRQKPLEGLKIGDTLVLKRTGAYSVTEGMSLFLSRDLPQIVLYSEESGFTSVRERIATYPWNCPGPQE